MHVRRDEAVIVQHDRLVERDAPVHPQRVAKRHAAFELDLLFRHIKLHPIEAGDEVIVPIGPAVFPVRRGAQADFFLLGDGRGDAAVLDLPQGVVRQGAGFPGGAGGLKFLGPQQTANVIGAEGWGGAGGHARFL